MIFKPTESEQEQLDALSADYEKRWQQEESKNERLLLFAEYLQKIEELRKQNELNHFKEIATSPEAIVENAREQVELAIRNTYIDFTENLHNKRVEKIGYIVLYNGEKRLRSDVAAFFAKEEVLLHINALKGKPKYTKQIYDYIVETVKTSKYTDNKEVLVLGEITVGTAKRDIPLLAPIPNSSAIAFLNRAMNNIQPGSEKKGTEPRVIKKNPRNRHEEIITGRDKQVAIIERTNKQSGEITRLEFENTKLIFGKNRAFPKMLAFSLQELCAQNFPAELDIDLQKMVDYGMYSCTDSARNAVKNFFDQQLLIKIGGVFKRGKKIIREECGVLFYHRSRNGSGHIVLSVNEKINMEFFTQFFTVLPSFSYALSENGFSLIWYIFYLARQNMKAIKENGSFNINLDTIREALGLPSINEVKDRKWKQYIITPIMKAITEIMDKWKATKKSEGDNLELILHVKDNTNITEWLQGYIEVRLQGGLSAKFIEQAEKAERERAKREKLKDEAQVRIAVKKAESAAPAGEKKR